jgi:hypothetical protein
MELNPNKFGAMVECVICGRTKQPIGRSAPSGLSLCNSECGGFYQAPLSGSLWPNESETDFGYPVSDQGTVIVEAEEKI